MKIDAFLEIKRNFDENNDGGGGAEKKSLRFFCSLVILRVAEIYEFGYNPMIAMAHLVQV